MLTSTVIIATLGRPQDLRETLQGWQAGTVLPQLVRVVDASQDTATREVCGESWVPLMVEYVPARARSAALQRNQGVEGCSTDLVIFCDDDVLLPPDVLEKFIEVFAADTDGCVGGVAGMIVGLHHRIPGRLLRWYYGIQAGYAHETYGGLFFGPAINTLPTDEEGDPTLYRTQWLNTGLTGYRAALFEGARFPAFPAHSFQEDVHLSVTIGREHTLYVHRDIRYIHKASGVGRVGDSKSAFTRTINRWYNASVLLDLHGFERAWKFLLSLLFEAIYLVRVRPPGWPTLLYGGCLAWWRLAVLGADATVLATGRSE